MRDMSIGSAGAAARSQYASAMGTVAVNSWDPNKLIKAAMDARSAEKQAAMTADAAVRSTEIQADELLQETKIDVGNYKAKMNAQGTIRKAGLVAAAGALAGTALQKPNLPEKPDWSPEIDYIQSQQEQIDKLKDKLATLDAEGPKQVSSLLGGATETARATKQKPRSEMSNSELARSGSTGYRLMTGLVGKGLSPVTAAAIAGNAAHESGNFRHYEELAPNTYGTKGVGYLQWTNAGGGMRRTEFENWAKSKGLDPRKQTFEASLGYIDAEMKSGQHWTGGMNLEKFKGITDLNQATRVFQDTYLRPSKQYANTDARLNYAQQFYDEYTSRNQ